MSGEIAKAVVKGATPLPSRALPLSYDDELDRARRDLRALQRRIDVAVEKADSASDSYKKEVAVLYEVKGLLQYTQNRIGVVKKARSATLDAQPTPAATPIAEEHHSSKGKLEEQPVNKSGGDDLDETEARMSVEAGDQSTATPSMVDSKVFDDTHDDSILITDGKSGSETPKRPQPSRNDIAQRAVSLFDNESGSTIAESFDGRINGLDLGEIIGRIREYREKNPPENKPVTPTTPRNIPTPSAISPPRSQPIKSKRSDTNESEPATSKKPIRRKRGIKKPAKPMSEQTTPTSPPIPAEEAEAEFPVQAQLSHSGHEYAEQVEYAGFAFSGDNVASNKVAAEGESTTNELEASTIFTGSTGSMTEETGGSSLFSVETFHGEEGFQGKPLLLDKTTQTVESPVRQNEIVSIQDPDMQADDQKVEPTEKYENRCATPSSTHVSALELAGENQFYQLSSSKERQELTLTESMESDLAAIITLILYPIMLTRSLLQSALASANRSLSRQGLGFLVGLIFGAALQWNWMQARGGLTRKQLSLYPIAQELGSMPQEGRPPSSTLEILPPREHIQVIGRGK